ncbi:hypothetical protein [Rhodococcus sp. LB1]|uniref:hypothetical protein n=1 Tax=Rhodococcus sp. LB1 TaxID=1807499 RepID=UPI0012E7C77B|nr:hypothetical protein [Rhodococcus sp. LB1]
MSLTSQIEWAGSPFMRFAQRSIPNPGAVTAVHDGIRKHALRTKSSHTGKRPDWGLIGTAIDFRLRLAFTTDDLVPVSARRGHAALTRNHPEAAALLGELTAAIASLLAEAPPQLADRIELPESIENDLLRLCVVAGQLDQLYRSYLHVIDKTPLLDGGRAVTFDQARAQVPWFVIDQLHDQVCLANTGLGELRARASAARSGMSFSGSDAIGGADADLLVDGLLLDFKSTHAATTITKSDVYQLAGYALLDFDDEHHIDHVGIYWTRHGIKRTFSLPGFFELLGATETVPELRAGLRAELTAYNEQRQRARDAARSAAEHREAADAEASRESGEEIPVRRIHQTRRWLSRVFQR